VGGQCREKMGKVKKKNKMIEDGKVHGRTVHREDGKRNEGKLMDRGWANGMED